MENKRNDKSIIKIIDIRKKLSKKYKDNIINVLHANHVKNSDIEYLEIRVKAVNKVDGKPNYFIAYLAHSDNYCFDVLKFNINDGEMIDIELDFDDDSDDDNDDENPTEGDDDEDCEDSSSPPEDQTVPIKVIKTQFVVGSAFPQVATAKEAVESIAKSAELAGHEAVILLGDDANLVNYKKYLASDTVVAFCNIGHGNKKGIMVSDGSLTYKWFNTLKNELKPKVIYFNSCITYNNPLWQSIMTHGTRTYIAGKIKLKIGLSEQITSNFWLEVLNEDTKMLTTVNEGNLVESKKVNFGLAGDGGVFKKDN